MSLKLKGIKTIANKVKQTKQHECRDMKTDSAKQMDRSSKKQTKMPNGGVHSKADLDSAYIPTVPEGDGQQQPESSDLSVTARFESFDSTTPMSIMDSASSAAASKDNDSVKVFVRVRPPSAKEIKEGNQISVQQTSDASLQLKTHDGYKNFSFDAVVGDSVSQELLFQTYAAPIVERCLSGYNGCIFAYGQTGSGKTYTMLGDASLREKQLHPSAGIIPRVFRYLFELLEERRLAMSGNVEFECRCSFLEIYNETITDLLDPKKTNLQVREDKTGTHAAGLTEKSIYTMEEAVELMTMGAANRKVAHTQMNAESSRSHSILSCIITTKRRNNSGVLSVFRSRLNLVDLAGSERQSSTGARGARLKEASSINKSLSTLGLVILSLADTKGKKARHIPYRDSKLTFLLQDSLGGNANAVMISNISPSTKNITETLSTLRFARGAKRVKNKAVANHACEGNVSALKAEIIQLKEELKTLKEKTWLQSVQVEGMNRISEEGVLQNNGILRKSRSEDQDRSQFALRRVDSTKRTCVALSEEIVLLQTALDTKENAIQEYERNAKLKDDKIQKLEDMIAQQNRETGEEDAEIQRLKDEVAFFKEKADRAPDARKYALENVQLKRELSALKSSLESSRNRENFQEQIVDLQEKLMEVNEEIKRYREMEACKRKAEEAAVQVAVQPTSRISPFMRNSRQRHGGEKFVSRYFAHIANWAKSVVTVITKPLAKLRLRMRRRRAE